MSWEDIERLETRLIYKDEQISDLTKENDALREDIAKEEEANASQAEQIGVLYEKLAAAEARAERLEKAARDMCREWRLHGQLTDSCRPMERVLGIHAPFCPTWGHKDCECDLRAALLPPPEPATVKCPDCHGMGRWPNRWPDGHIVFDSDGEPESVPCERCARSGRVLPPPPEPAGGEG